MILWMSFCPQTRMNVGVAHSEVNPNTRVMNSRGIWLTYALGVGVLHIVLLSIPFFSVPVVWTLTNVIHNLVSSVFSHAVSVLLSELQKQTRLFRGFSYIEKGCLDGAKRSNKKYDWGGKKNAIQCFELHCINWNMTSLTSSCCISHRRWTSQLNCSGLVMVFSLFTLQMSCRKCSELQPRLTWWVEQ